MKEKIHSLPFEFNKFPDFDIDIPSNVNLFELNDLIEFYDPTIDDCPVEFLAKQQFTSEEDILLFNLVETF